MKRLQALGSLVLVLPILLAGAAPADPLERLAGKDVKVSLRFDRQPLPKVLKALGAAAGFQAQVDPGLEDVVVTVDGGNVTVREVLARLCREHGLRVEVPAADRLVVSPSPRSD